MLNIRVTVSGSNYLADRATREAESDTRTWPFPGKHRLTAMGMEDVQAAQLLRPYGEIELRFGTL